MSFFNELKRRNVVRVAIGYVVVAWLVAQVVELAADSFGAPDWVMKMVITMLALGLLFALFFAWAFELTPEGLKREKDVDRSQSITSQTGRKLDRTIIFVLVLALGYFVADKFWLTPSGQAVQTATVESDQLAEKAPETIAVLPFVDMSPEGDNEYFSDGLTEELLNILAKIQHLQVAGRTSSFAFKGRNEDLRSIGEKLGVNTILEGSVRKDPSGARVRITAQLVNVENGFHLWSETYDRELKDIFAIQDEIAHEVATALRITLLGEDEARLAARATTGLNAYELYLQALEQYNDFSYASLRQAEELYLQSVAADPDYLPAWLGLGKTLRELVNTGAMGREEYIERIPPIIEKVFASDPDNAEARVLSAFRHNYEDNLDQQVEELEQALTSDPRNTLALIAMARTLYFNGDTGRAMEYLGEAERTDPYSVMVLWNLCALNGFSQQVERAQLYCDRIGEVQPDNPMRYYGPGLAEQNSGHLAKAVVLHRKSIDLDPNDHELPASLVGLWLDLDDVEQAETWMKATEAISPDKTATIAARISLLHYREQSGFAGDLARRALQSGLDRRPGSSTVIEDMFVANAIERNEVGEALAYFEQQNPRAFETPPTVSRTNFGATDDLINIAHLLLQQDGDSVHAQTLLNIAQERLESSDGKFLPWLQDVLLARIAAIRGQNDKALELVEAAVAKGLRVNWRAHLEVPVVFDKLRTDARFQQSLDIIRDDLAAQREEAHRLVAEEFGP